jgi:TonB family protein
LKVSLFRYEARGLWMNKWRFRHSLIVSLLVHTLLLVAVTVLPHLWKPPQYDVVEITFDTPPTAPIVVREKKKDDPLLRQQVVDQDENPVNDETPEKAKFLSSRNQVVQKQTVAQNLGEFRNRREKGSQGDAGGAPKIALENLKPKMDFTAMMDKKRIEELEIEKTLDQNAIQMANQKYQQKKDIAANKPGAPGAESSQTSDYLKDLDKGMETLLSTREFVYYSFYARIRRQLNQHWGGKVREKVTKIIKEGRSIASTDDKVTRLMITLNRQGQLVKVQVLNDSGIRDLDDAAIEAFQEAAPFPNPPDGIVEADGTIKIRWDFILEA